MNVGGGPGVSFVTPFLLALVMTAWIGVLLVIPALVCRDAQRRGQSGLTWWVAAAVGGLITGAVWLAIRSRWPLLPPYLQEGRVTPAARLVLVPAVGLGVLLAVGISVTLWTARPASAVPPVVSAPPAP